MKAAEIFDLATNGGTATLAKVVSVCQSLRTYCLVADLAVNCYVEPVYTLDADFVVVAARIGELKRALVAAGFRLQEFPHSLNAQAAESELRIQFTNDPRYQSFLERASEREVLGIPVRVAVVEDVVQGKLWAYLDPERRLTKRKKDELDLLRLAEAYPQVRKLYPPELQRQLES